MPKSPYQYQQLETYSTIRVLLLQPSANYEDPLHGRLVHIDRKQMRFPPQLSEDEASHYECVSYYWGEPHLSHTLACDGCDIPITQNVDVMLRHLRKTTHARPLWVDAICLNQANEKERAIQVLLMGRIYRDAKKVQVWLGPANNGDQIREIMALLEEVARIDPDAEPRGEGRWLEYDRVMRRIFPACTCHPHEDPDISSIQQFLSRPWFQRRWVVQEVCLGVNVMMRCGAFKISWETLATALKLLGTWMSLSRRGTWQQTHIDAVAHVDAVHQGQAPILDLLWRHDVARCSDHRDGICALLGMADDLSQPVLVKYTADWNHVYTDFARKCVHSARRGHEMLTHAWAFGSLAQKNSKWPSWVPDWSEPRDKRWDFRAGDLERKNLGSYAEYSTKDLPDGRVCLTIEYRKGTAFEVVDKTEQNLHELKLGQGHDLDGSAVSMMVQMIFDHASHPTERILHCKESEFESNLDPFGRLQDHRIFTARLMDAATMTIGIGPACMAKGDWILPMHLHKPWWYEQKLQEGRYPIAFCLVLRPLSDEEELFSFIGMSFVCVSDISLPLTLRDAMSQEIGEVVIV